MRFEANGFSRRRVWVAWDLGERGGAYRYGRSARLALESEQGHGGILPLKVDMAKILIFEPETRYRVLLRYILEGIHHRVIEAGSGEDIPRLLVSDPPDLVIVGVHLDAEPGSPPSQEWHVSLPDVPTLLLFSGEAHLRGKFLAAWDGPKSLNVMVQPVDPYPLLTMVKSMLTAPEVWRRGGQHIV